MKINADLTLSPDVTETVAISNHDGFAALSISDMNSRLTLFTTASPGPERRAADVAIWERLGELIILACLSAREHDNAKREPCGQPS